MLSVCSFPFQMKAVAGGGQWTLLAPASRLFFLSVGTGMELQCSQQAWWVTMTGTLTCEKEAGSQWS